jgi:hypothetical protein
VNPQVPVVQVAVPFAGTAQPTAQPPQSSGSLLVSTHCPLQFVFGEHAEVQAPAEQASPAAHFMPQPPQLLGSLPSCTQLCPQAT